MINIKNYKVEDIPKLLVELNFSDLKNSEAIESRILPIYLNKEKHDYIKNNSSENGLDEQVRDSSSRRKQTSNLESKWNGISISSDFNHASGFSLPWINNNLLSIIKGSNPNSCFKSVKIPTRSETSAEDKESIRKYTSVCRRIFRPCQHLFYSSSIAASAHLGLTGSDFEEKKQFLTMNIETCIEKAINDANAGYPTYLKKNNVRAINDARTWITKVLNKPNIYNVFKNILLENPKVLFHRFQPKLKDNVLTSKIRQVWCEPFRIILLENHFFRNIIDHSIYHNTNSDQCSTSSGLRNVDISNKIIVRMRHRIGQQMNKELFSLDYSKYDSSIPDFAIDLYFLTMEQHLDLNEKEKSLYHLLRYYTKYGPIIHEGKLYFKRKGISSGSLLTNHFDSWWNLVLNYSAKALFESNVKLSDISKGKFQNLKLDHVFDHDIAVTGDDIIKYCSKIEIYYLQDLCSLLGMKVEVEHSTNNPDDDIFFLGRFWNKYSEPIQTEQYFTSHICFRGTFYKNLPIDISEELEPSRILSICAPYKNGFNYMIKTFQHYKPLMNILNKRKFIYLKDFPLETKNKFVSTDIVKNWKMF